MATTTVGTLRLLSVGVVLVAFAMLATTLAFGKSNCAEAQEPPPVVIEGQLVIMGEISPPGQARAVEILTDLSVADGEAGIGLRVAPTQRVPDGSTITSLNALEIDGTYIGLPALLNYLTALSVVNPKFGPEAVEASTVRIDGAPRVGQRKWALLVSQDDGRPGGGAVMFEGNNRHHIGAGNTDNATQLTFRTTADPFSRRGVWLENNLQGIGPGDMGIILLVSGTLKEPPSGAARGAGLRIDPPVIVDDGGEFSDLAALYILGAPTGGANNYAVWVGGGLSRFDGEIMMQFQGRQLYLAQTLDDYERRLKALERRLAGNCALGAQE